MRAAIISLAYLLLAGAASAAGQFTNGVPAAGGVQFPSTYPLTGAEALPADTNLPSGTSPQSESITTGQLAGYQASLPGTGWRNGLIGGDFGNNLWQRGTTSASITTALTYGPDAWWGLSGAATAMAIFKQTGASDVPQGYLASARVERTAGQTGIVPVCVGQVLTSQESARLAGQQVEFTAHMLSGAQLSSALKAITMIIGWSIAGATDQSAASFANASWTGYSSSNTTYSLTTAWARYSALATIPATASQVGVKICYTPVGTAGTTDWFEFTGAQLDVNPNAIAMTGVVGVGSAASFERRPVEVESLLQYARYQQTNETNNQYLAAGVVAATNAERAVYPLITSMRKVPTCTFVIGGFQWNIGGSNVAANAPIQAGGSTTTAITIADTVASSAGSTAFLKGTSTTGQIDCTADL